VSHTKKVYKGYFRSVYINNNLCENTKALFVESPCIPFLRYHSQKLKKVTSPSCFISEVHLGPFLSSFLSPFLGFQNILLHEFLDDFIFSPPLAYIGSQLSQPRCISFPWSRPNLLETCPHNLVNLFLRCVHPLGESVTHPSAPSFLPS
jgi:hypothetical protein